MAAETHPRLQYRFGPYQVTPEFRELRNNGTRIKLHEQPFEVLLALLERPGELVTREYLRRRLWPHDTFVDFDKGLNTAVNKVRQALCDSAANPRYIETVPRHGYRFVAALERLEPSTQPSNPAETPEPVATPAATATSSARNRITALVAIGFTAVLALLVWTGYRRSSTSLDAAFPHVTPLTAYPGREQAPSFSPDGSQVAFERCRPGASDFDIQVQVVGAPESVSVAATPANEFGPAWSSDGSLIAYLRSSTGTRMDLLLVPPTGGKPRKLTSLVYPATFELLMRTDLLAWTPDGTSIVFPDAGAGEHCSLWAIDRSSGQRRRITTPEPRASHSLPRFTADGRWLAYQQQGGQHPSQVLAVPLTSGGLPAGRPTLVTSGLHTSPLGWLGHQLCVLTRTNTRFTIEWWSGSAHLRTVNIPNIGGPGARLGSGALSRDGRRLALTRGSYDSDIWQLDLSPAGEALQAKPLIESTFLDLSVDHARDGRRIVFKSTRSGSHEAWIAAADGTNLRRITDAGGLGDTRLSPDGSRIVVNRGEGGNADLFVADVGTGLLRRITNHAATDENPRWSLDGNWIYFNSDRSGRQEIWKVRPSGGEAVQVTRNRGINPFESPDGQYLYFGKEEAGEGHVWRMPMGGGPEERLFPALVNWASLAMGSRRMYFVRGSPADPLGYGSTIYSYDLADGRIGKVAEVGATVVTLSPSPDEKRLLFGRVSGESDLMLIEGLRQ